MTSTIASPTARLADIAATMTGNGRGILAADESSRTMSQRLEAAGITASETTRRDYREVLLTAPGLAEWISGMILADETFGQRLSDGRTFPEACLDLGILPGIKVDTGTSPLPRMNGALVTEGLDGLGTRLASYADRGAAFAKWRAVIDVTNVSAYAVRANAAALARYAALCQEHDIVPIVEPEVLCGGSHTLATCAEASSMAVAALFEELVRADIDLTGVVLKPNFVTPGLDAPPVAAQEVAAATYQVLRDTVPTAVPGIAFLSGGHATADVCAFLSALVRMPDRPWNLTFSFGRALVSDALHTWAGDPAQVAAAQEVLLHNCQQSSAAAKGADA